MNKKTDSGSRVFDRLFKVLDEKGSRYYTGEIKVTGEFNGAKQTTTFYPKIWAISKEAAKQRLKQQISKNWKNFKISGILKETSKTQDTAPFKVLDNAKQLRTKYKISYDAYYTAGVKLNNGKYSRSETEKRISEVIATSKQEALQKLKNGLKKAEKVGYRYSNFKIIKIEREPVYEKLSEKEKLNYLFGDEAKISDSEKQFIPPLTKFKEILKNATGDNKKFKWIINSNATGYFTTKGDMISFIAKSNNKGGAGWATGKAAELEKIYTRFKTQILPYN